MGLGSDNSFSLFPFSRPSGRAFHHPGLALIAPEPASRKAASPLPLRPLRGAGGAALIAPRGGRKGPDRPDLQNEEEKMSSLKPAFDRAREAPSGLSLFWLLVWAITIDDDRLEREKRKRERDKWRRQMLPVPGR
jgi:hypothetical protein